jgi:hypothetical protein
METINWQTFKETLVANPTLQLQFQYAEDKWVDAAYHITEIKQAPITSVDCGGVMNAWTEIIVQLYEPQNQQQLRAMEVNKALGIINVVERALPLNPLGIVKIEFGNSAFDTRQMLPNSFTIDGDNLIVDLRPDAVQCKAIDRGGSCGTPAAKPVTQLKNLATAAACCEPGGCGS